MDKTKKCHFGVHQWVEFNPIPRKDKKYQVISICSRCGKQKTKVIRK